MINLSIGEPEIEPSRDIVALALDAAAAAGVVPVVAAGNDYDEFGRGSLCLARHVGEGDHRRRGDDDARAAVRTSSPASRRRARRRSRCGSSPTSRPRESSILSSVPDGWSALSGTSMAAPHVAGAAALLRQRHPGLDARAAEGGAGRHRRPGVRRAVERPRRRPASAPASSTSCAADRPLVFALAELALVRPAPARDECAGATVQLADAGDGAGTWTASVELRSDGGATLAVPATVAVPGHASGHRLRQRPDGEVTGVIALSRAAPTDESSPSGSASPRPRSPASGRRRSRGRASTTATPAAGRSLVSTLPLPGGARRHRPQCGACGARAGVQGDVRRPVANFGVVITRARAV